MIAPHELTHILYQLGEENQPGNVVSPPIYLSSNFSFRTIADFQAAISNEIDLPIYSRGSNPTVRLLEQKLAALQGTESALCFGSGSAAVSAAVVSSLKAGDHVITINSVYSWTWKLLAETLSRFGVTWTQVDGTDSQAIYNALQPNTRVLMLESPTSLNFHVQDMESLIRWGKSLGLIVICDNSFGSPLNRKPVEFGADLICHSATKYVGGHSDVVAGVVCGSREHIRRIFYGEYMTFGATLQAEQAWLLIRSLRTLPQRMEATARGAREVVRFLKNHDAVAEVNWIFDEEHPKRELVRAQFDYPIPMFSFRLNTMDTGAITRFCESLKLIRMAVSWGGFESLLLPAIIFPQGAHPVNHFRLYIGLEDPHSLVGDLGHALQKIA